MRDKNKVLIRKHFMGKVIYNRLIEEFGIENLNSLDITRLIREFDIMIDVNGYRQDVDMIEPISYNAYINLGKKFITSMKTLRLVPLDADDDEIDMEYINAIIDCLLWANKLYLYCSYYAHDKSIMTIKDLKSIRGPFYDDGYTTLLDLALIYANTNEPKYIDGVGPQKYSKFKKFFTTECTEFKIYEKEHKDGTY